MYHGSGQITYVDPQLGIALPIVGGIVSGAKAGFRAVKGAVRKIKGKKVVRDAAAAARARIEATVEAARREAEQAVVVERARQQAPAALLGGGAGLALGIGAAALLFLFMGRR